MLRTMVMNILRSKKFAKRVLLALLVLIIPAFVLWGAGTISQKPALVGRIGRKKIRIDDLAKSVQGVKVQILLTYFNDSATLNKLIQNRALMNNMAWERLILLDAARDKHIRVNDNDVRAFISQHPLFQKDGRFDLRTYNYILRHTLSLEPHRFEKLIRDNLRVMQFRNSLFKDISVTEEELRNSYRIENDQVDLSYILIDKDLFADKIKVHPEETMKYYRENKEKFVSPARADIEYVEISYQDLPRGEAGMKLLNDFYAKFRKAPEKFKEIAEKTALRYGRTGLFSREELIPGIKSTKRLHNIAFSLEEDEVSPPVFSGPGEETIYILHKIQHVPPVPLGFEDVKEKIGKILVGGKCMQLAEKKANQLYERTIKTNLTLEEAAEMIGQETKTATAVNSNAYIQDVGPARPVVTRALGTEEGSAVPPITIGAKGVLLVRVDKIIPADEAKFEQNKDTIRQNILSLKQMDILDGWLKENQPKIKLLKSLDEL